MPAPSLTGALQVRGHPDLRLASGAGGDGQEVGRVGLICRRTPGV
ncbi:hypothetical protein [Streptomyces tanashiensis]